MQQQELCDFFSRLSNRTIEADTPIALTSAQRARFLSWAEGRGAAAESLRASISGRFTVADVLSTAESGVAPRPPASPEVPERLEGAAGLAGHLSGIGIDIQAVSEIIPYGDSYDFRSVPELAQIFTDREISYACGKAHPRQTLAGLFAAKEALIKANPEMSARRLSEIEILPNERGIPTRAGFQISISHSGEYAIAMAIAIRMEVANTKTVTVAPSAARAGHSEGNRPSTAARVRQIAARSLRWVVVAMVLIVAVAVASYMHRPG